MGQMKPPSNSPKKPVVKPLRMKNVRPKSFFEEHYYAVLLAMLCIVTILLKAGGMSFKDASLAGLLFTALVFFATQVARYFKERSSPGAEAKIAARPPQRNKRFLPRRRQRMRRPLLRPNKWTRDILRRAHSSSPHQSETPAVPRRLLLAF